MFRLLLIVAIVIVGGLVLLRTMTGKPLQGMVQVPESREAVLASCARPAVYFLPAADMRGRVAGWRTVRPKARRDISGASARLTFALYDNGTGLLVTALAEAEDKWLWEAPHHTAFPAIYTHQQPFPYETNGADLPEQLHESVYVLDATYNPFASVDANKGAPHLVYRAKAALFFRKMLVLYEYHETLDSDAARDMRTDHPLFDPFLKRAREACSLRFMNREQSAALAGSVERPEAAPEAFARTELARWLGEMHTNEDL